MAIIVFKEYYFMEVIMTEKKTIGRMVLQIALGLFFAIGGVWTLQGQGNEIAAAVHTVLKGDIASIAAIVMGIIEVIAGAFLILRLFISIASTLDRTLMLIITVAWIAAIVLLDFLGGSFLGGGSTQGIMKWLYALSQHLLVLGALLCLQI